MHHLLKLSAILLLSSLPRIHSLPLDSPIPRPITFLSTSDVADDSTSKPFDDANPDRSLAQKVTYTPSDHQAISNGTFDEVSGDRLYQYTTAGGSYVLDVECTKSGPGRQESLTVKDYVNGACGRPFYTRIRKKHRRVDWKWIGGLYKDVKYVYIYIYGYFCRFWTRSGRSKAKIVVMSRSND